jgi:hypothetical protein
MEKRLSERGSAQGRFMAAAARNEAASDGQPAGIKVQLTFPASDNASEDAQSARLLLVIQRGERAIYRMKLRGREKRSRCLVMSWCGQEDSNFHSG